MTYGLTLASITSISTQLMILSLSRILPDEPSSPEHTIDSEAERRKKAREQRYLWLNKGMSLSVCYSASIGGTATLTGTTPNLILKGQMDT